MVLWRPTRPFRTNTQKRCPFHYRGLECKSSKSRTLISNLKNLGMVCLHWQNKVIYPSHSAKLLSQFLTYSPSPQAPNTSKNFLFPERNHLYILTWRLIYIKTQLIRELFLSRSNTDECSMCTEQGNAYFLPLQLNGEETLNK